MDRGQTHAVGSSVPARTLPRRGDPPGCARQMNCCLRRRTWGRRQPVSLISTPNTDARVIACSHGPPPAAGPWSGCAGYRRGARAIARRAPGAVAVGAGAAADARSDPAELLLDRADGAGAV